MKENIKLGLILLLITGVAGFLLGGAYEITKAPIANSIAADKQAAMKAILPTADKFEKTDVKINEKISEVNSGLKGNEIAGYAIKVAPKGYAGPVEIMVGISNEGKVTGIKILAHTETPGLGANAPEPKFSDQFKNKPINEKLEVVKVAPSKDNQIQAITGATITSKAVTLGVSDAIDFYNSSLKGAEK
ncbi:RnfABCDGE type electron transport complex subunit G [Clostridium sp. CM028]|uniref:RnfABCDGE type electron transport complex subunit G n=1 Tax=Clostridium TaxID=1485 RepID=UPI0013EE69E6|nr:MULTISPECIES: RnfABCDGE type electron transport complex subunit G [Clostridium]MBU3090950.1 RnfABCDGE type electron transport complex subunit G [Clostridium sp. CF011]MBW9144484.1 RnfABCDGE type electron transport complex subunit G [Clostridium sp. CM027]MBW9147985.1 RnfABCDGE type electron transport complex subunit G [Clostridium sp. CM028]MBZ9608954.1 RnfABCDGE type electron transport complex subunit G [Clostridium estertheticum]UVE40743.1 RnfABCDGE type electron transport complex subunit